MAGMEKEGLGGTSLWWIGVKNLRTYSLLLVLELYRLCSRASTNGHLSTADCKTDPFFVPVDNAPVIGLRYKQDKGGLGGRGRGSDFRYAVCVYLNLHLLLLSAKVYRLEYRRFPFNLKFEHFRNRHEWYGHFQGKDLENSDSFGRKVWANGKRLYMYLARYPVNR